jgi:MFS family permease
MNGLQTLAQWNEEFGNPSSEMLGLVNGIIPAAMFCALPFTPWVSDKYGRKVPIALGCLGIIVATLIQIFAVNYGMFVASRAILVFWSTLLIQSSALLIAELAYPTHRGKYTSAYFTICYVGAILASWTTFGTQNLKGSLAWKFPTILQALLPFIELVLLWFVPQSPRWLVANDRVAEAVFDPAPLPRSHFQQPAGRTRDV